MQSDALKAIASEMWSKARQRLRNRVDDKQVANLGANVCAQIVVGLLANVSTSLQLVTKSKLDAIIETLLRRFTQQLQKGNRGKWVTSHARKRDTARMRRVLYDNAAQIADETSPAASVTTTTTSAGTSASSTATKAKAKKPPKKKAKKVKRDDDDDDIDIDDDEDDDIDTDDDVDEDDVEDEQENDDVIDDDDDANDVINDEDHGDADEGDLAADEAAQDDVEQERRTTQVMTDEKRSEFEK